LNSKAIALNGWVIADDLESICNVVIMA
jgi:hypothetical protein